MSIVRILGIQKIISEYIKKTKKKPLGRVQFWWVDITHGRSTANEVFFMDGLD